LWLVRSDDLRRRHRILQSGHHAGRPGGDEAVRRGGCTMGARRRTGAGRTGARAHQPGGESERGGKSGSLRSSSTFRRGSEELGAMVTGVRREGGHRGRAPRHSFPPDTRSSSPHAAPPSAARRVQSCVVGDPGGERGSLQSSRLTSASPARTTGRLRQRRSCRASTSRSPGARRSARYHSRLGAAATAPGSELLGREHAGQEHRRHQPGPLLVLGQAAQPIALE
jgi:hypothetical protein